MWEGQWGAVLTWGFRVLDRSCRYTSPPQHTFADTQRPPFPPLRTGVKINQSVASAPLHRVACQESEGGERSNGGRGAKRRGALWGRREKGKNDAKGQAQEEERRRPGFELQMGAPPNESGSRGKDRAVPARPSWEDERKHTHLDRNRVPQKKKSPSLIGGAL